MILLPTTSWKIKDLGKIGRGLFATKQIPAGTIIGDYIGKVIHGHDEYKYDNKGHFYLMYYHDNASIYPDIKSDGIHVVNHSCAPNTWMYTYKGHALFFAIRTIFPGEELTVSYLLGVPDSNCKPCMHMCKCKSIMCTGTMHLPEEKFEKWVDFDDKMGKKTKRARIKFNKTLPLLDAYPNSIPDASIYTLFGNPKQNPKKIMATKLPIIAEIRALIRESGKTLIFPKLNIHVLGVTDDHITSKSIK